MPTWIALFMPVIIEAIQMCIENRSSKKVGKGLHEPGRREYRAIVSMLRKEKGWRGRKLRRRSEAMFDELQMATNREVNQLLACGTTAAKANAV